MCCTGLTPAVLLVLQVLNNTWRLCHNYVDPSCLLEKDADMCVFQHIEQLMKGQQQSTGPGQLSPGITAAVVAAGMVATV